MEGLLVHPNGPGCIAAALALIAGGCASSGEPLTPERVLREHYEEEAPQAPATQAPATRREAGPFNYARRGDRIEITLPCPDLALCVAPPHFVGRITPDGLIFDHALSYRTPLRYQRVSR